MATQIRDAGSHWNGEAYWAAYDRIVGDRDIATKVADETDELADATLNGGTSMTSYREVLLGKVAEATDVELAVADDWTVGLPAGSDHSYDDDIFTYQTAIKMAFNEP
jgi:hypothetical protein